MSEIYGQESYGDYAENHQEQHRVSHDMRAIEVRQIAEDIFQNYVSDVRKVYPTGTIPDPVRETGYPEWHFDVRQENIDSVNLEDVQKRLYLLREGASIWFFEFVEFPKYDRRTQVFTVKLRQV